MKLAALTISQLSEPAAWPMRGDKNMANVTVLKTGP